MWIPVPICVFLALLNKGLPFGRGRDSSASKARFFFFFWLLLLGCAVVRRASKAAVVSCNSDMKGRLVSSFFDCFIDTTWPLVMGKP